MPSVRKHIGMRKQIEEALPNAAIIDAADLFRLIRVVKTPDEIAAMKPLPNSMSAPPSPPPMPPPPSISEYEVTEVFAGEIGKRLGKWRWFHMCSGRRAVGIFPPTEKKLEKGGIWKFDAGLALNNHQADTGWGGTAGEPGDEQAKIREATVVAGFEGALSVVKAGVLPSRIHHTMPEATRDAGLPGHNGNFTGHAIGLEQRELRAC